MTVPSPSTLAPDQSVLGYVLRERIGSGGYGEVWSAEAPGGLIKAIKFVFGFHDENRAQRELKALDRIKHIRHPFLLSLERIDIVDGRMVVISELADMCLKTRFNQCREKGLDAIPRDELLQYMREAADALDYLADEHSLAHLDIKPENLLLVGGHAKVADFGLVKELHNVNQSLMDGLTPAYAAPELFDGQPGRASDQYSLAIVFLELLTATRPFSGTTAAQLANQHLHGRPNLNSLPRADQAIIARAMNKDPKRRFPDCRTLFAELAKRRHRSRMTRQLDAAEQPEFVLGNPDSCTTPVGADSAHSRNDMTMTVSELEIPSMKFDTSLEKLAPLEIDESAATVRPTLFVGVGRTGTWILNQLKQRITQRYGEPDRLPAFRYLCLDVDRNSLNEFATGEKSESLRAHEILAVPLRRPDEYRNDPSLDLGWIGRRWIYNIPRSQLTESLRPLGRLAFVDHHESIYQRLHDELERVAREENLATTAETTDLLPSLLTPQVIFVASIAGGAASGMLLDLAFSARIAMGELGLTDDHVYALLAHGTSRQAGDHRLAIANSFCFLSELYHYNLNGYPGSEACGIPEFDNETPVFDAAYVVHMGDDLQQVHYDQGVNAMAEYLFLGTATRTALFMEKSRDSREFDPGTVRTMGMGLLRGDAPPLSLAPTSMLVDKLLGKWLDSSAAREGKDTAEEVAQQMLAASPLECSRLENAIVAIWNAHPDGDPAQEILKRFADRLKDDVEAGHPEAVVSAMRIIDGVLGEPGRQRFAGEQRTTVDVCEFCDERIRESSRKICDDLSLAVLAMVDDPAQRAGRAIRVAEEMQKLLQLVHVSLQSSLQAAGDAVGNRQTLYRESLAVPGESSTNAERWNHLVELIPSRLSQLASTYQLQLVRAARVEIGNTLNWLRDKVQAAQTQRQQIQLENEATRAAVREKQESPPVTGQPIEQAALAVCRLLLPQLEDAVNEKHLRDAGGLQSVLRQGVSHLRRLLASTELEAQILVNCALQQLRIDKIIFDAGVPIEQLVRSLEELVRTATPRLAVCGGTSRLLIVVPQRAPVTSLAGMLQHRLEQHANVIPATCGDVAVCFEMDQLPIEAVAMTILQTQPDCSELIERLHCRNDVDWSMLTPLC